MPGGEGLSTYGASWYDAKLGLFLSADSIVPQPSDPQSLNRYSYVRNNPTGRVDPTGHYDITPGDDPYWRNRGQTATNKVYLPVVQQQQSYQVYLPMAGAIKAQPRVYKQACPGSIVCVPATPTPFPTRKWTGLSPGQR